MAKDLRQDWPTQMEPGVDNESASGGEARATAGQTGAAEGIRASLPVVGSALAPVAGAAIASVCLSCIGLGGAAAFGAAIGTVVAWATPVGFVAGGLLTVLFVRRELRKRRASCSLDEYRRSRRLIVSVTLLAASASHGLGALVVVPLVRSVAGGGGGGPTVLP